MIPQALPGARFSVNRGRVDAAVRRVFASGSFVLASEVEHFEQAFAEYLGVRFCIGVGNGTDAITLALKGLGIGDGDEVVTVGLTAAATGVAIQRASAAIRFVDVAPVTRCMDLTALRAAITGRTAAVVVVHLHGYPCPMHEIIALTRQSGAVVVEDCAHAHGATLNGRRLGSLGDAAAFSFYPTKNLGAPGDGGAVVTNDAGVAARIRTARQYGWRDGQAGVSCGFGMNSRLDELHAAVLAELLPDLDVQNERRKAIASRYREALDGLGYRLPADSAGHVYHQFAIEVDLDDRDRLRKFLESEGIGTGVHYPVGLQHHPAFAAAACNLPVTDRLAQSMLSLPVQPEVAEPHLDEIVAALRKYRRRR